MSGQPVSLQSVSLRKVEPVLGMQVISKCVPNCSGAAFGMKSPSSAGIPEDSSALARSTPQPEFPGIMSESSPQESKCRGKISFRHVLTGEHPQGSDMVGLEGFVLRCRGGGIAEELDRGVEISAHIIKLSEIAEDIRMVGSGGTKLFKTGNIG